MKITGLSDEVLSSSWFIESHSATSEDTFTIVLKEGVDELKSAEMICREGGVLKYQPIKERESPTGNMSYIAVRAIAMDDGVVSIPEIDGISFSEIIKTDEGNSSICVIGGIDLSLEQWVEIRLKLVKSNSYFITSKSHRCFRLPTHGVYSSKTPAVLRPIPLSGRPIEEHIYHLSYHLAASLVINNIDATNTENKNIQGGIGDSRFTVITMISPNIKCKSCTTAINRSLSKNLKLTPMVDFTQVLDKKCLYVAIRHDKSSTSDDREAEIRKLISEVESQLTELNLAAEQIDTVEVIISENDRELDEICNKGYQEKIAEPSYEFNIPTVGETIQADQETEIASPPPVCEIEEFSFVVKGMTCAACALEIEHHFEDHFEDVQKVAVNFAISNAKITVKKNEYTPQQLSQIINGLGFTAIAISSNDEASRDLLRKSLSNEDDIIQKRRAAYSSMAFSVPLLFLILILSHIDMVHKVLSTKVLCDVTVLPLIEIAVSTPVVFYWGSPFFIKTKIALSNKTFTMDVLVTLGVSTAYFSSLGMLIAALRNNSDKKYHYGFHTAASLIAFMLLGKYIEQRAKSKTTSALLHLMDLQPSVAAVLVPEWLSIPIKQIVKGDSVKVSGLTNVPTTSIVESGELQDNNGKIFRKGAIVEEGTIIKQPCTVVLTSTANGTIDGKAEVLRGEYMEQPVSEVQKGDFVRVTAGGSIPVDGEVKSGEMAVDESMLTGESIPVPKTVSDKVAGGSLCKDGSAVVRVTAVGADSCVSQIIALVSNAQTSKAPIQKYADRVAGVFVPAVIIYSAVVFTIWFLLGVTETYPEHCKKDDICISLAMNFLIATLVIACPCAMGLATPTAVMVGTGIGAKNGIFIKGGDILEQAHHCNTVIFDKTGTLSSGDISVIECQHSCSTPPQIHLAAIREVEDQSSHPIAISINHFIGDVGEKPTVDNHKTIPGKGVTATANNFVVKIGSYAWFKPEEIPYPDINAAAEQWLAGGFTVVVATTQKLESQEAPTVSIFALRDQPKPEATAVVNHLQRKGIEVYLVSGDAKSAAHHFASLVGIPQRRVFAEQLPKEKADIVEAIQKGQLQDESELESSIAVDVEMSDVRMLASDEADDSKKNTVAFVGDGINDAVALAAADVGIALGAGTSVALEAASCVLTRNNLRDVVTFLSLSTTVMNRIKLNFFWAFGYNVLAIPIASGFFYPIWHWQLPPTAGGIAMIFSSIAVLLSSLHLKMFSPPKF